MDKFIRYIGALFMEKKDKKWTISVGRVSWWITFCPAVFIWVKDLGVQDIADHHLTILLLLATYNMGKKIVEKFKQQPPPTGPE